MDESVHACRCGECPMNPYTFGAADGCPKSKMIQRNPLSTWRKVGVIAVDSGLCWIGDPCYVLHRSAKVEDEEDRHPGDLGLDWQGFCKLVRDQSSRSFNFDLGHEGLGVCTSTGDGDGIYPVEVREDDEGRVLEVRVRFD